MRQRRRDRRRRSVSTLTNVIDLITSDGIVGACGGPTVAVCDNGQVQIISSASRPWPSRSTTQPARGATRSAYTVDVTLPAEHAVLRRLHRRPRRLPARARPRRPAVRGDSASTALPGCDERPGARDAASVHGDVPDPGPDELARGLVPGRPRVADRRPHLPDHLPADLRRLRRVPRRVRPGPGERAVRQRRGRRLERHQRSRSTPATSRADRRTRRPRRATFADQQPRPGLDDALVNLVRPELAVDKECQALDGTRRPGHLDVDRW